MGCSPVRPASGPSGVFWAIMAAFSLLAGSSALGVSSGRTGRRGWSNSCIGTTGSCYFSGMYTAILPMIPGFWVIVRTVLGGAQQPRAAGSLQATARPS